MKRSHSWQFSKSSLVRLSALGVGVAVSLMSVCAHADESAYCRKVRAHAAADASLLVAPTMLIEGIKAPSGLQPGGKLDPTSPGAGYQLRAGFSFSPLDFYKGTRVGRVADADCDAHEVTITAQQLLLQAPELGRLGAFRDQVAFMDAQQATWEAVTAKMTARYAAQSTTLVELEAVRTQASALARQRAQIGGEVARLEATGLDDYRGSIAGLIRDIREKSMKFEREASHVRSLDAWKFNITGGYLPPIYSSASSDFFGVVQVGYTLGGPWHNAAEARYLDARDEELQKSRQEMARQLQVVRESVRAATVQATRELEIVEKRVAEITTLQGALGSSEAPTAAFALARLELELISAQADRVFLTGLIRELSRLEIN